MKTITLNISDTEYQFVIDLLKKFDFVQVVEEESEIELTREEKEMLDKRLQELKTGTAQAIDWKTVKEMLK